MPLSDGERSKVLSVRWIENMQPSRMIILSSQTLSYDGGVLCCAASDIEIKYQVSQFEMHFRDFSSFSSQCYISARWITSKNYRGESQKKSLTQGWKGRSHPWPLALWGEVKWRGENIHQSMDMIDMWRPTRKDHHKVKSSKKGEISCLFWHFRKREKSAGGWQTSV